MSLNLKQKQITAHELQINFHNLVIDKEQILNDLKFTSEQLEFALKVSGRTNGYDVWKLRDYLEEKLQEQGREVYPFSILKQNIWFPYQKTW